MTNQPENQATPPNASAPPAQKTFSDWLIPGLLAVLVVVVILKPILSPSVVHLDETIWRHDTQAAMAEAKTSDKPVLALFTADWCPPCQDLKKQVLVDAPVATTLAGKVQPVYVDMSNQIPGTIEMALAERYGVLGLPAVLLLTPEGLELGRINWPFSADEFGRWLDETTQGPQASTALSAS